MMGEYDKLVSIRMARQFIKSYIVYPGHILLYKFAKIILVHLGFVSPCIIIQVHSNKSTNQMHQSLRFIARRLNTAQHV